MMVQKSPLQNTGRQTVTILPETEGQTLCLRFTGLIRKEDHFQNLYEPLAALVERYGGYNMLIEYKDCVGWEPEAADVSMRSILELGKFARRLAYVNPPEKKILTTKLAAPLFGGEIRNFNEDEFDAALKWVKETD